MKSLFISAGGLTCVGSGWTGTVLGCDSRDSGWTNKVEWQKPWLARKATSRIAFQNTCFGKNLPGGHTICGNSILGAGFIGCAETMAGSMGGPSNSSMESWERRRDEPTRFHRQQTFASQQRVLTCMKLYVPCICAMRSCTTCFLAMGSVAGTDGAKLKGWGSRTTGEASGCTGGGGGCCCCCCCMAPTAWGWRIQQIHKNTREKTHTQGVVTRLMTSSAAQRLCSFHNVALSPKKYTYLKTCYIFRYTE